MMSYRILVIEDDIDIQEVIKEFLLAHGFLVDTASDGIEGVTLFNKQEFDLVVLDIMMPNLDGYQTSKIIRSTSNVPIIMLTALEEEQDQVKGFESGIDDYITKPFSFDILIKRVEAILRRSRNQEHNHIYTFQELKIDCDTYRAFVSEEEVILTTKEFKIIQTLLEAKGKVVTREAMLDKLWGYDYYGDTRILDTHMKNIRKKLNLPYLRTVKGIGYKIGT
ncbi:response regulator transcription factor [Brevibacillus laterosporus]|uniref:response regulator transcription factor n=1 Tax=Brevibacillus laterosporus TaxID=1465 RepID=UPI0018CFBC4B|nr:response regulator transcription factor [Brevibacillus laterosporus]MCR8936833.1 response regulator transcription factor [Brevibacillus laterosporus]MCZ0839472.1 response regulator transcription factor [Brevibacillus laterosporus]MCZ0845410.1 response regulator transcription factor [Brevibacillus laterosporus]MED1912142.1 response regulator transcription factor [Brevibacillus laterosporus]